MFHLTSLGESQLRLTVPKGVRLSNAKELRINSAGSEGNVCALLSQMGRTTSLCTCVPDNGLGDRILSEYRSVGVDLSATVTVSQAKAALYFLEPLLGCKPANVIYDRDNSAFCCLQSDDIKWDTLLDTRSIFVTGITAGLNENTAALVAEFCTKAVEKSIPIFLDVNYRSLIWTPQQANQVLTKIARRAEVVFCSISDAKTVFKIQENSPILTARKLREHLGVPVLVSTDSSHGAYLVQDTSCEFFPTKPIPVLDRPGAGDAFVGGVIEGYLSGDLSQGMRMGHVAASLALSTYGDVTYASKEELLQNKQTDIVR